MQLWERQLVRVVGGGDPNFLSFIPCAVIGGCGFYSRVAGEAIHPPGQIALINYTGLDHKIRTLPVLHLAGVCH